MTSKPHPIRLSHLDVADKALPLNEQIYRRIRQLIQSGILVHGARVASSRTLAASLGVSRNSVMYALDRLIADEFLESRTTSGLFVSYPSSTQQNALGIMQENVPFSLGLATDIFPVETWRRLQLRRWRNMPLTALYQGNRFGLPELRKAIATYLASARGITCSPSQVIVTTSISAGVNLAIRALKLPHTEAWVEDPCIPPTVTTLINCGVGIHPVAVDEHGIDVEEGIRTCANARAVFVSPTCQIPSGVTMSEARRKALLRWARTNNAWIFEDDYNWNGDGVTRSALPLAAADPSRVIYFNSFNSILFTGLRVAYLVVPQNLLDSFSAISVTEGDVNTPNQLVLTDFIEGGYFEEHVRRLDEANRERRAALDECVRTILPEHLAPRNNPGGFYTCALRHGTEQQAVETAKSAGIALMGYSTHCVKPPQRDDIFLGYSQYTPRTIATAARELHAAFQKQPASFSSSQKERAPSETLLQAEFLAQARYPSA